MLLNCHLKSVLNCPKSDSFRLFEYLTILASLLFRSPLRHLKIKTDLNWDFDVNEEDLKSVVYMVVSKYRRSGVPNPGSSSRRISELCNLSRVKAKSQNWKIEVELLDLESSIESNTEANIEFLLESDNKYLYIWVSNNYLTMTHKWSKTRIVWLDSTSIRHIRLKYRYLTRTRGE